MSSGTGDLCYKEIKRAWLVWPSETRLEMGDNDSSQIHRGVNIGREKNYLT